MLSDLEIARRKSLRPIVSVASDLGIREDELNLYGRFKAKVNLDAIERRKDKKQGKYIVVTAITPTPLGEGKTVITIGLAQALQHIGKRAIPVIRQPSQGPVFGIKGGAAGGGYAQALPMEDLNLHFTGDFHAITAAHNLLAAMINAHLFHGNTLEIDPLSVTWTRVLDVLDRSLRQIVTGLGGARNGFPRETSFEITAASEIMAILALARSPDDLRERLGRVVIGYTHGKKPVTADRLKSAGAMAVLLKDALHPNLIQTLEGGPALVHAGPFGNIAHGCSSIRADELALRLSDYVVTEAGFGADLGFEKFCHIKCRASGLVPDAAALVCTVRSLKAHSGRFRVLPGRPLDPGLERENLDAVQAGAANLIKQIENVKMFGVPALVAFNRFSTDTEAEIALIERLSRQAGAEDVAVVDVWAGGGAGGVELARAVVRVAEQPGSFRMLYAPEDSVQKKIETVATRIYGAERVDYEPSVLKKIRMYQKTGFGQLPVCMAKTQYSLSHDPDLKGKPAGFSLPIVDLRLSAGAGFLYALCGEIMTMLGLSSNPAAMNIDLDDSQQIEGLS